MITPNLINLVQKHNRLLSNASIEYTNPFGEITEYRPFHAHHMLIASQTDGATIINGAVMDVENPSEYDMSIIVGAKVGHPTEGGGAASTFRDFPIRGGENSLDRYMKNASASAFRIAVQSYNIAYTQAMVGQIDSPYLYFSEEKPNKYRGNILIFRPSLEKMIETLSGITSVKTGATDRLGLSAVYSFNEAQRYMYNSDGFDIFDQEFLGRVVLAATIPDEDGRILSQYDVLYFKTPEDLPSEAELKKSLEVLERKVRLERKAPIQMTGHFPVILDPENTGVFFHEVVGHSLEGDSLDSAHAFRGQIGERVAKSFLNLYDDPTIERFNGVTLNGHYKYDDEGVEAQRVELFENGVLRNFLHSRTSAGKESVQSNGHSRDDYGEDNEVRRFSPFGRKLIKNYLEHRMGRGDRNVMLRSLRSEIQSNGHSRSDYDSVPETRMGNIFVSSSNPVSRKELREMLIEEIRQEDKPYGIMVLGTNGGYTLPENSLFDVTPKEVWRVYADQSKPDQLVRGVYLGGRIRQSLDNVVAMSDDFGVFNGMCGSESGWVPNSEVAPSSFVKSIEVCTIPDDAYDVITPDVY